MEDHGILMAMGVFFASMAGSYWFWRRRWFIRNPHRTPPAGDNIVSPADGTVVYVKELHPHEEVLIIKKGLEASVSDIVREDAPLPKLLIGVFMSPFNVHYNRSPIAGTIEFIRHHPPRRRNVAMGSMHWRTVFRCPPYYRNSRHIVENARTVTKMNGHFKGAPISCYVVQIAGKTVNGIDSYFRAGASLGKGEVFGMIRIGSQVDLIVPTEGSMNVRVRPGDKVRAGETILVD